MQQGLWTVHRPDQIEAESTSDQGGGADTSLGSLVITPHQSSFSTVCSACNAVVVPMLASSLTALETLQTHNVHRFDQVTLENCFYGQSSSPVKFSSPVVQSSPLNGYTPLSTLFPVLQQFEGPCS